MNILKSLVGIIGNELLQIAAPTSLLQISAPLLLFRDTLAITAPIPFLQIESSNQLLICEPLNQISVYLHEYDLGLRCLILHLINPELEDHKSLLEGIFTAITTHEAFINFGNSKSVIVSAIMHKNMSVTGSSEYNFHHNVLIDSTTTFNQYYNEVGELVNTKFEHGYSYDVIESYKVKVWNLDLMKNSRIKLYNKGKIDNLGVRNYSTSRSSSLAIKPLQVDSYINPFTVMDLETIELNGNQTPIAISTCNSKGSKLFVVDHLLLQTSPELAVNNLWKQYFDYILKTGYNLMLILYRYRFYSYRHKSVINSAVP